MPLINTGQIVLDRVRRRLPSAVGDVFLVHSRHRSAEWSEGKPENRINAVTHGMGVRVIDGGRPGFSHTNRWDNAALDEAVEKALASSRSTAVDPYADVPLPSESGAGDLDLVDGSLVSSGWDTRAGFLGGLESEAKKQDKRIAKILRGSYSEAQSDVAVVNTRGIAREYSGTSVGFSMACVAVDQAETQIGYAFQAVTHYSALDIPWVIRKAVEHTVSLLGGRRIPSGRYDLVLDPFVGAEMLELLAAALRADRVQKGRSFLGDKIGSKIGSPVLKIVDNGLLRRGLGSAPVDAEGLPARETILIENGMLKNFLYDSYTARKAGHNSTGNAGRSSYKALPGPEPTNFYLEPGMRSPEDLLRQVKSGIYVRSVMGLHTVDTVSGDFSLGLMGERIENGAKTHGVRGVTMAGNVLELLKNIEALGSDLTFSGSVGSPTIWVRDISVGGA
jgi:PmbA protein